VKLANVPALERASAEYRQKREALLDEERALLDRIERVAEQRRNLPEGPQIQDVTLESVEGGEARLSELFGDGDVLLVYNMMFAPDDEAPCPMCTRWVDGFNAVAPRVKDVARFVILARKNARELARLARNRGWTMPLYSAPKSYGRDVGAENADGDQMPLVTVFRKSPDGRIFLWYSQCAEFPNGTNRGIDLLNPLWNLLDLLPQGRGDYLPPVIANTYA
jgi:predicted dithiol-disulfide oxidoreductase (DUF899 family)